MKLILIIWILLQYAEAVWLKGTISDGLMLRKIFKPFTNNENTVCQSQHIPFSLKQSHNFDIKTALHHNSFRWP